MAGTVKIDAYWCLVEDRSRVVPETDPEATFLHWRPGDVVDRDEAKRLGAIPSTAAPSAGGEKNSPPAEDKAVKGPAEDKSGLSYPTRPRRR